MGYSNILHTHQVTLVVSHRHRVAPKIGDTLRYKDFNFRIDFDCQNDLD